MSQTADTKRPRDAWADWVFIVIFVALLCAPVFDKCFDLDHSKPPGENRLPAQFPELHPGGLAGVQRFVGDFEAYFNDHFGFRKRLIRWFQHWRINLFKDRSVYKVVIGPNRWLFSGELQMVEHYLGTAKFTPQQLHAWQRLLEKRRDWLAQHGIKYLFVVPPDKQNIYPDELPLWLSKAAPANRETKLDQFLKYMNQHSTVKTLDMRRLLVDARRNAHTYLQNDAHWNLYGGFLACQELINTVSQELPGLPLLKLENFQWAKAPATGGDLAQMLGSTEGEANYFVFNPKPTLPTLDSREATNLRSIIDPHKNALVVDNQSSLARTAVVFHDSFGLAWQRFLGYAFKSIVFMPESREFNTKLILQSKPNIVITEMLERYFNTRNPEEMIASDALP